MRRGQIIIRGGSLTSTDRYTDTIKQILKRDQLQNAIDFTTVNQRFTTVNPG
jgi:hypothetical protein